MLIEAGKIKRIHVNQHIIKANRKNGESNPPLSIICGGKTTHHMSMKIRGEMEIIYSPQKPLGCGAEIWMETKSEIETVEVVDKQLQLC